jgi:serine/threonine-protein kinase
VDDSDDAGATAAMGVATPVDALQTPLMGVATPRDNQGDETTNADDDRLGPGVDVGGYVVDGVLGSGGMGVVYEATHPVIGKRAAIKVLRPELSKDPSAVERFVFEARAVNEIGHPNIVDIFAFGALPDGRSYYVMDRLVGESLRERLKRGPLHVSEAASVIDETASALAAAHAKGFVHRDLKPDNVFMVTIDGRWPEVKLLDFGLVKLLTAKTRTLAGSVLGTPRYMSPEQARGEPLDGRSDVYSLGVMAFELLAGEAPFIKRNPVETLLAHAQAPIPSLAEKFPSLPIEVVQLVEAMMAKAPGDRPTLAAIRAVLKRLKGTKIPTVTAVGLAAPIVVASQPSFDPPQISDVITNQRMPAPAIPATPIAAPLPPPEPIAPFAYAPAASLPPTSIAPSSAAPANVAKQPSRARSLIVILVVAVVCSAIGVIVALNV